jgi:hypothetical protein
MRYVLPCMCRTGRVLFDRFKHRQNARTKSRFRLQAGTVPLTVSDYKQALSLLPGVQIGFETHPIELGILFTG